jgi:hypothetical protein
MNQLRKEAPSNQNSACAEVVAMAERELTAFFAAIKELFGSEQADRSAEDWLRELNATDALPSSIHEWRRITLRVSARTASLVNALSLSSAFQTPA